MHVLGTPPAFVLSQDQTLHRDHWNPVFRRRESPANRRAGIGEETPTPTGTVLAFPTSVSRWGLSVVCIKRLLTGSASYVRFRTYGSPHSPIWHPVFRCQETLATTSGASAGTWPEPVVPMVAPSDRFGRSGRGENLDALPGDVNSLPRDARHTCRCDLTRRVRRPPPDGGWSCLAGAG